MDHRDHPPNNDHDPARDALSDAARIDLDWRTRLDNLEAAARAVLAAVAIMRQHTLLM